MVGEKAEGAGGVIPWLSLQLIEIDGVLRDAGTGAGFQPSVSQTQGTQLFRQVGTCGFSGPPRFHSAISDEDLAIQKGATGEHDRVAGQGRAIQ
jgi:hypothetical protein